MLFNIPSDVKFQQYNKKYYLYADSNMFGYCRFGDLMIYSTLLCFLKKELIEQFDYLNENNIFFIFNLKEKLFTSINEIRFLLSIFNGIWGGLEFVEYDRFNIRQILTPFNLWSFKTYLDYLNIKASDPIISPSNAIIHENKKTRVYINPIRQKQYNTERNLTDIEIIDIVNSVNENDQVYIITKDNNLDISKLDKHVKHRLINVLDNNWNDILIDIMSYCKLYIGGDCGLSHFISLIDYNFRPIMNIYYRTKSLANQNSCDMFNKEINEVNFKPYDPYKLNDIIYLT